MSEIFECLCCGQFLGRDDFFAAKTKLGIERQCKKCRTRKIKEATTEWRVKHKDHLRAKTYSWRAANPDRYREHREKSRAKHMKKVIARNQQRLEQIKRATPPWADKSAITDLYVLAKVLSRETGMQLDVDHVVPLRGRLVCGLHVGTNLRLLPRRENQLKHNRFAEVPA